MCTVQNPWLGSRWEPGVFFLEPEPAEERTRSRKNMPLLYRLLEDKKDKKHKEIVHFLLFFR